MKIAQLRERIKKKSAEKRTESKKSEPKKIETSKNFGKIMNTLDEMKNNLEEIQLLEKEKNSPISKEKPKLSPEK